MKVSKNASIVKNLSSDERGSSSIKLTKNSSLPNLPKTAQTSRLSNVEPAKKMNISTYATKQ